MSLSDTTLLTHTSLKQSLLHRLHIPRDPHEPQPPPSDAPDPGRRRRVHQQVGLGRRTATPAPRGQARIPRRAPAGRDAAPPPGGAREPGRAADAPAAGRHADAAGGRVGRGVVAARQRPAVLQRRGRPRRARPARADQADDGAAARRRRLRGGRRQSHAVRPVPAPAQRQRPEPRARRDRQAEGDAGVEDREVGAELSVYNSERREGWDFERSAMIRDGMKFMVIYYDGHVLCWELGLGARAFGTCL